MEGVFSLDRVRKKLAGGGIAGGVSLGFWRLAIGCGSLVCSLNGLATVIFFLVSGFPAAMGAWAAAPERPILSLSGDGGFGQYLAEFTTAVKYGMNITHILLNNSELGKISKEQRAGEWPVWQTALTNPSFAAYAKLCGGKGVRVTKAEQLHDAFEEALSHTGPALVEIITDVDLI